MSDARADEPPRPAEPLPFLKQYCVDCHGPDLQEGRLRLDTLGSDLSDRETARVWIEVRDRIDRGEMPPNGEPRPTGEAVRGVSRWITSELRRVEREALAHGGRVPLRRLNRDEYAHTVADLLHLRFAPGESPRDALPPDGTAEGFRKVGSALLLDPSLATTYYRIARDIAEKAIVEGEPEFPTETMRLEFEDIAESRAIGYLVRRLGMRPVPGGLLLLQRQTRSFGLLRYPGTNGQNVAPTKGFYRFTLRAGGAAGADGERPRVRVTQSHPSDEMRTVMEFVVDAPLDAPQDYSVVIPRDELGGELHVEIVNEADLYTSQRPGEHFMQRINQTGGKDFAQALRLRGRWAAEGAYGDRNLPDPEKLDITRFPRVFLDSLEVEGPLYESWPPPSHQQLLFEGDGATQDLAYARRIFERFLPRAWRRPITPDEATPIVTVVERELAAGRSFEQAIRAGLVAALVSPNFLYIGQPGGESTTPQPLSAHGVAERLSYLLWSSLPDEKLRQLAASDALDARTIEAQVDRMLADPKSSRFVEEFASQWLRTETFLAFAPDRSLYREYDEELGTSAAREPVEFFRTVLTEDLPVTNFLDSDFVVVDERLADHYGLAGVEGDAFRKVPLEAGARRGGLLGMMGVHMAGADGVRTKPVSRGVYVREVLFGDPPDPPPANVGEIEPNVAGARLTVRERLLQHQQIASCAACHRGIDPYGLALENFNVIGRWRDVQDGEDFRRNSPPIDASGRLPDGREFGSFAEFRTLLASQDDRFRRALAEKLFVYALGRPVEPTDDAALSAAVSRMKSEGDTLRALLKALATSRPFLSH